MIQQVFRVASLVIACTFTSAAFAGIDHIIPFDESGIWSRSNQLALRNLSALTVLGGALWEGNDSRLGKTFWKTTDAMLLADLSAEAAKRVFRRARPNQGNNPNDWFGPSTNKSFPSGEVTHITAIVTPFIAEYGSEQPAVWALAVLPVYDGIARMKSQAHWQTDVLAGMALGGAIGYAMQKRESAWTAMVLPRGITIGFKHQF